MPRGYTDDNPAKGRPHRRVREKIELLLRPVDDDAPALVQLVLKIAEKRPEDVLDALCWLHEDRTEEEGEDE